MTETVTFVNGNFIPPVCFAVIFADHVTSTTPTYPSTFLLHEPNCPPLKATSISIVHIRHALTYIKL